MLLSFVVNDEIVPTSIRLVLVVALSCVLLCSQSVLENKITANPILAKIGAASYSVFVWHQVVLAFYRSIYGRHFTPITYSIVMALVALVSWLSYHFIEQGSNKMLETKKGKKYVWIITILVFVVLNAFALYVYKNAGVVRDIPELEVSTSNPQRGMWANYNADRFSYDRPFKTDKRHWFIIGNSYGRDFVNIILESSISDSVEISYCDISVFNKRKYEERFKKADKIFIASKEFTEDNVHEIELLAMAFGHSVSDVIVVGDKNFGETMEQVYVKRLRKDYSETRIEMAPGFWDRNEHNKELYGDRFVDLIEMVCDEKGMARVFTDEQLFISSDCGHLTKGGARFFANRINWSNFL